MALYDDGVNDLPRQPVIIMGWMTQKRERHPHWIFSAHLVPNALLAAGHVVAVLVAELVAGTVGAVGVRVVRRVAVFLGALLAVALAPLGLVLAARELVEVVVVVALALAVFVACPPVLSVPLSARGTLLTLLLVALPLTPAPFIQRR